MQKLNTLSSKVFPLKCENRIGGTEYEGKVVKIGIRTIIIETNDGDTVTILNSAFTSNPVVRKKRTSTKS